MAEFAHRRDNHQRQHKRTATLSQDNTRYIVTRPDEMRGTGNGPSSPIPTLGAATRAIDQYRTIAVHSSNLAAIGAAFTDVNAVNALTKIAEKGRLRSHLDLEAAETALQALILHENVHVLTHAPKVDFGTGLVTYARQDKNARNELAFQLMNIAASQDFLVAPELITVQNGCVISSTLTGSPLIGRMADQLDHGRPYWNEHVEDALNVTIEMHGIPAYLTHPSLIRTRLGEGFAKQFYKRMRQPWDEAVGQIPKVVCTFSVPPLLAIVLDRLNNRSDLTIIIEELRNELAPSRRELLELNQLVTGSTTETEIAARIRYINESFDAIIPESRMTNIQRRRRNAITIQRLTKPIIKFATGFLTKSGNSFEQVLNAAQGIQGLVAESDALVDRTVTARTFSGLLRETEALQALVKHHLTDTEILAIEKSMRKEGRQ